MSKNIRILTAKALKVVATEGDKMGFNRQIAPWVLRKLAKGYRCAVDPLLIHEHIAGRRVEPHLRTLVGFKLKSGKIGAAFIDMSFETFERLPKLECSNGKDVILADLAATRA